VRESGWYWVKGLQTGYGWMLSKWSPVCNNWLNPYLGKWQRETGKEQVGRKIEPPKE